MYKDAVINLLISTVMSMHCPRSRNIEPTRIVLFTEMMKVCSAIVDGRQRITSQQKLDKFHTVQVEL